MPSLMTLPNASQILLKAAASLPARLSSSPITRPVTALRIAATCGLFCSISREMLSGRSSLSMTPRTKRR